MRSAKQLFRATGTNTTVQTGTIDVEEFHSVGVAVQITGLAGTSIALNWVDDAGNVLTIGGLSAPPIGNYEMSLGREVGETPTGTAFVAHLGSPFPVPRLISVVVVVPATSTAVVTVFGAVDEPDNL